MSGFVHPFAPEARADPYPGYRWLQQNAPVYDDPMAAMWLLTKHTDCAMALRDRRFSAELGQRERLREDELPVSMLNTDPPRHAQLRAPGQLLLGPTAVRENGANVSASLERLLTNLASHTSIDAVTDIGEPFAGIVLADTLEIPGPERATFVDLGQRVSASLNPLASGEVAERAAKAMIELDGYLDRHLDRLVRHGRESPLQRLILDGRLNREQVIGILKLVVVGGYEPLTYLVANALAWLLPRPTEMERIRRGGAEFGHTAVDELLRLESPIPFALRVTTADVEIRGTTVPAGNRVLILLGAANRDPTVFDDPDRLVLDRSPNPYLAFGSGPHYCLGAGLVRRSGASFLPELLRRFPALAARDSATLDPPRWRSTLVPRGVDALALSTTG